VKSGTLKVKNKKLKAETFKNKCFSSYALSVFRFLK